MLKTGMILSILISTLSTTTAQSDSTWNQEPTVNFSGFIDIFYAYSPNRPQSNYIQPFLFNHNRHNEFNLNLGLLKAELEHPKYRATIALQTGTYAIDNYAHEPDLIKNIYEANIGVSMNKSNTVWVDAGIFESHIGFESAISSDNFTLTRSLLAENSPYYLSGVKLTYVPNSKWEIAALLANGWQRIQRLQGNSLLSIGTQVMYKPNKNTVYNWSTYIGTDDPDDSRRMRYFNNFFGQFQISNKIELITGLDFGIQQKEKGLNSFETWYCPIVIGKYQFDDIWRLGLRYEYFNDNQGVIIPIGTPGGFTTSGISMNLDYSLTEDVTYRIEGRWFKSDDKIFETENELKRNLIIITASLTAAFD